MPRAGNPRLHPDWQIAQIARSIEEWGWTIPILVDEHGEVIAGHGRIMAALKLDIAEVPVMIARNWTEAQKRAYVIADNQLALNGAWDDASLKTEIAELNLEAFDVSLLGFGKRDLEKMLRPLIDATEADIVPALPSTPMTRTGDIWTLGRHRLICADCTDAAEVDRLLAGCRPSLCLTDPPYGIGKVAESGKNDYAEYIDSEANTRLLADAWLPLARERCAVTVFSAGVLGQYLYPTPDWVMCWYYGGGPLTSPWGFSCWQPFLCYGKEPGLAVGAGRRPDAVDLNIPARSDLDHPCPKPFELWRWMFDRLIFDADASVFDPFCGAGTTLVAAEVKSVTAYCMEIDPGYCDVSVKRWETFTGQQAVLERAP